MATTKLRRYEFTLAGRQPLLMHADDVEAADELEAWRKDPDKRKASKAGDDRSPAWTWQSYCYTDGEHLAWPAENLMVALRSAGAQLILKKQKTFKEMTQSGLIVETEFAQLLVKGKPIPLAALKEMRDKSFSEQSKHAAKLGFRLWAKRARVGQAKHVRVRPRFDEWSMRGVIVVVSPEITAEILTQLFTLAGNVGTGDWRPGCRTPGVYGQFDAALKEI